MDLESVVRDLARVPNAFGAIVCDFEGESVVHAVGSEPLPREIEDSARSLMPDELAGTLSVPELLLMLAGAGPSAILRQLDEPAHKRGLGGVETLHVRYDAMELLIRRLPDEYYVVLALRPRAPLFRARARLEIASRALAELMA